MQNQLEKSKKAVIIGAGPAGLTAAYELCKAGIESVVLEKDNVVGGLARTVNFNGYYFDMGGHRFFTKVKVVEDMWHTVLGENFLVGSYPSRAACSSSAMQNGSGGRGECGGLGLWNS